MYQHYYTSSDVTVDLYCPSTSKRVNLDTTIGIAYNENVSSVPVYTLGNSIPTFFSKGNSLVQGQIDLVFTGTDYLVTVLEELLNVNFNQKKTTVANTKKKQEGSFLDLDTMSEDELIDYKEAMKTVPLASPRSLVDLLIPLEIIVTFNNTNATMDGNTTTTRIEHVKFYSKAKGVSSQDDVNLVTRLSFLGSALIEGYN